MIGRDARRLAAALGLGLAAGTATAQPDAAAQRQQVEQRVRLVAQLIADSPTAQRIAASGDPHATAHLDEGRVHHALALDLLARGDLAGARRALDDALRHIGMARRMVPDAPARLALARQRYDELAGSTGRLLQAYRERALRDPGHDNRDLIAADALLAEARQLAAAQRHENANRLLVQAEQHLLAGTQRLLQGRTLDYSPSFAGPADEYEFELRRHASLRDLLPLALQQLKPGPDALALIERYTGTGRALQAQALRHAQAREHAEALAAIRAASQHVERALQAAGLALPAPAEGSP